MAAITATLTAGTAVELSDGRHQWLADEPLDAGGTDTGPSPYDLLLGALAACTCITLSLYASNKGITLHSVTARFEHDRVHRRDCEDDAETVGSSAGYLDRIRSEIVIAADADDAQRRRLAEVAVRCPVHRTLERHIQFSDTVEFRGQR